uniref:Uncharacterized protein n=1 Tax=Strigamia maritima TaxID=126957 RepID=T1J8M6_STRMM
MSRKLGNDIYLPLRVDSDHGEMSDTEENVDFEVTKGQQQVINSLASNGSLGRKKNGHAEVWESPYKTAVEICNLKKSYGSGTRKLEVLTGISSNVPKGAIYGLLGPSGCGKTTLLRLIIGRLDADSGYIKVFGDYPGSRELGIPGEKVGYMPQEIALYNEFTIRETMYYFGRVHNMPYKNIEKRMKFLLDFLHLPKESRFIKNLSGGQKRRVSFAVALLQEPPLLILDEPTVGVDPLLRQNIWNHLITLVQGGNTTVIITTHYIEEARQANVILMICKIYSVLMFQVGLMRNGRILAEDSPANLLSSYDARNLEEVFLKLCVADQSLQITTDKNKIAQDKTELYDGFTPPVDKSQGPVTLRSLPKHMSTDVLVNEQLEDAIVRRPQRTRCRTYFSTNKAMAMIIKNFIRMWRNVGTMVFQFIIPSIQIILFCLAIGHRPEGLDVGVVNFDNDSLQYGQAFINTINNNSVIVHPYDDLDTALEAVKVNEIWGVIYVPFNFSQNLLSRFYGCMDVEDEVLEGGKVRAWLDMTNQQIWYALQVELIEALQNFTNGMLEKNGINPSIAELPLSFEAPLYGENQKETPSFTEFMAPGIILSISYFMAVGLTALAFVLERKDGLLDRTYVAGVDTIEIMVGHFFTQFFVMLVQIGLSLLFMIVAFNVPCRGSAFWVIMLTILQGSCGMFYGLLISAFCEEEHTAIMFALGSFYPNLLLSGIIWPLEGMPWFLRYISYGLPQTYPTEALRAMLTRGWGITHGPVLRGFAVTLGWLGFFIILTMIAMKFRR